MRTKSFLGQLFQRWVINREFNFWIRLRLWVIHQTIRPGHFNSSDRAPRGFLSASVMWCCRRLDWWGMWPLVRLWEQRCLLVCSMKYKKRSRTSLVEVRVPGSEAGGTSVIPHHCWSCNTHIRCSFWGCELIRARWMSLCMDAWENPGSPPSGRT